MRLSTRARLAAAQGLIWLGLGGGELERLFLGTAQAFGASLPPRRARGVEARLREYAAFTRRHAEAVLARASGAREGCGRAAEIDRRLFQAGRELGQRYRGRFGVRSMEDVMSAARVIYAGIGIDFRGTAIGPVEIRRCRFAKVYSPRVCEVISALDRGVLSGLSNGGELRFCQRLTEGAASCRATFEGAKR